MASARRWRSCCRGWKDVAFLDDLQQIPRVALALKALKQGVGNRERRQELHYTFYRSF